MQNLAIHIGQQVKRKTSTIQPTLPILFKISHDMSKNNNNRLIVAQVAFISFRERPLVTTIFLAYIHEVVPSQFKTTKMGSTWIELKRKNKHSLPTNKEPMTWWPLTTETHPYDQLRTKPTNYTTNGLLVEDIGYWSLLRSLAKHSSLLLAKGEVVLQPMSLYFRAWPRMFYEHTLFTLPPYGDWNSSSSSSSMHTSNQLLLWSMCSRWVVFE